MASGNLIEIQGLSSTYGQRRILHELRFGIPRNGVTVIMGPSGCGKTTLLRHLIGLKRTLPRQLFVDGEDLGRFSPEAMKDYRRRIGVLFQSGALFNSMTLHENIAVPLNVHTRLARETIRVMALIKLHLVGLSGFGDYMPSQLSGGMRKRAGLARAMAMDPEILFVDEPSSGLDPITAAGLDRLLVELKETLGMTIIVVTHELESAFLIADQMAVLDQGRVLAAGSPDDIRKSRNPRVMQFLRREADRQELDTSNYLDSLLKVG
ncbi:MAG: ATP-binding cassette domain-containing protein [Syntrophobacteraceae bacterium]|jgi:phospholipid/cholesterol/gamma-HCH transport system ATP-binding protein|nr:ATP-binding cassette domain-containing protein [Syntrophobacteraceae bacterium]